MSLTNPKTVVTEERLAEFYQGIFPYLGGMPEILANKFSKSDMYSTTEKMVGQWTDNKPLYQKTFTGNSPNADFSQLEFATLPADAELFWITDAFLFASGSACVSANGMAYSAEVTKATVVFRCWISSVTKKIMMTVGAEAYRNKPCYVTVLYTKTTDSAISIGNDTDYSTTEKIVGTWITGKPIYQKTLKITDLSSITSTARNWYEVYTDSSVSYGMVNVIDAGTFIVTEVNNVKYYSDTDEYINEGTPAMYTSIRPEVANATGALTIRVLNSGATPIYTNTAVLYVTLQYTKTTD